MQRSSTSTPQLRTRDHPRKDASAIAVGRRGERDEDAPSIDAWCDAFGAALARLIAGDADLRPRVFVFEDVRFVVREIGSGVAIAVDATLSPTAVAWRTPLIAWREKHAAAVARAVVDAHFELESRQRRLRLIKRATARAEAAAAATQADARRSTTAATSSDFSDAEHVAIAG